MAETKRARLKRRSKEKAAKPKSSLEPESNAPAQEMPAQKKPDALAEPAKPKPKPKVGLTLNWNRAIHINTNIDDKLLKDLTPVILRMKQESSEPITVGIDSPGGSLSIMQSLLGLLKSPDQDGIPGTPYFFRDTIEYGVPNLTSKEASHAALLWAQRPGPPRRPRNFN